MFYLVQTRIATGTNISKREYLDERTEKITRRFSPEDREKIKAIRLKHISIIKSKCFNFFGLAVCRQEDVPVIKNALVEIDRELKTISSDLEAEGIFLPVPMEKGSEIHRALVAAIRHKVFSELVRHLQAISARSQLEISPVSHKNLGIKCDELAAVNLTGDQLVATTLATVKNKMVNDFGGVIEAMQGEITRSNEELDKLRVGGTT